MRISDWSSDVCSSDLALRNLKHTASKRQPPRCPPVPRKAELIKYGPDRGGRHMILPCDTPAVVHSNRVTVDRQHLIAYDYADGLECLDFCARRHTSAPSIPGIPVTIMAWPKGRPPA